MSSGKKIQNEAHNYHFVRRPTFINKEFFGFRHNLGGHNSVQEGFVLVALVRGHHFCEGAVGLIIVIQLLHFWGGGALHNSSRDAQKPSDQIKKLMESNQLNINMLYLILEILLCRHNSQRFIYN